MNLIVINSIFFLVQLERNKNMKPLTERIPNLSTEIELTKPYGISSSTIREEEPATPFLTRKSAQMLASLYT